MVRKGQIYVAAAASAALLMPAITHAVPASTDIVGSALSLTISGVTGLLQTLAFKWLSVFVLAQFLITNLGLLKSGADIEAVMGKLMGSLLWFGFCFYVVTNGADFIKNVGNGMFDMAGSISGAPGTFSAGYIFDWGFTLSKTLMNAVNVATGSGWFAKLDFMPSLFTFFSCLVIMLVSALIGFKVFLVKIELMLTIMMSPLSFSFLGLSALKDQGISPFKSLISLTYRVMLLAVLVSVMGKVGTVLVGVFGAVDQGSVSDVWNPVFAGLMVFSLMGYLAFKSDAIAANLASGSTNLGTADVATAAAMGAAAGAAVATGGTSAAAGAAKAGKPMGDFMKSLIGGGSSVSNASASGAGPSPIGTPPVSPSLSKGPGTQAGGNKAPVRSMSAGVENAPKPTSSTSTSPGSSNAGSDANAPAAPAGNEALTSSAQTAASGADSSSTAENAASPSDNAPAASASSSSSSGAGRATDSTSSSGSTSASSGNKPPVRTAPAAPAPSPGHTSTAGIGGSSPSLEKQLGDIAEALNQPKDKTGLKDHLSTLNEHVKREQASTQVSINPHSSD